MSEQSQTRTLSQRHRDLLRQGDIARGKRAPSDANSDGQTDGNSGEVVADADSDTASTIPSGDTLAAPLVDGRFRLLTRLGSGRLGEIYEARVDAGPDAEIERHVALQLFDRTIATDPELIDELRRGFASLRASQHRNIVRLDEFGHAGRTGFLLMELLEGVSLRFVLDDAGPLPSDEIMPLVGSVGDALSYLHAKRLVHGALTPGAVFVEEDYRVKLLDIVPSTHALAVLADGEAPSRKDDIYGLACLTYELLTGRHPFNCATAAEARELRLVPAPIADLPQVQWRALAHGLSLDPEHRSSSVASFVQDFGSPASGNAPDRAPPVASVAGSEADHPIIPTISDRIDFSSPPPSKRRWLRRGVAIVLLGGLAAAAWIYRDPIRDTAVEQLVAVGFDLIAGREDRDVAAVVGTTAVPDAAAEDTANLSAGFPLGERPVETVDDPAVDTVAVPADESVAESTSDSAPIGAAEPEVAADTESGLTTADEASRPIAGTRFVPPAVVRVTEGGSPLAITIGREGDTSSSASLVWWTRSDTALPGDDYADFGERTETFAPGEVSVTIFVPIVDDGLPEPLEGFVVLLGRPDPVSGRTVLVGTTRVVIEDDDNSRF
jgi:hypothetical protein